MIDKREQFLSAHNISDETWNRSSLSWESLVEIGRDHQANTSRLREAAEFFAKTIQTIETVHSVRWRIKDTSHLIEKIIRKRAEGTEKYEDISLSNYHHIVTDLVGLRAIHLFKKDYLSIDRDLRTLWEPIETPIIYIREGDQHEEIDDPHRFEIKTHKAGYRSVHYVFGSKPLRKDLISEIQVRTIFEEGWSEIDHRVRYPNFSDDPLVAYFLKIFNRFAGGADEMGEYVSGLSATLSKLKNQLSEANTMRESTLKKMESTIEELNHLRQQDESSKAMISNLKNDIANLRVDPAQFGTAKIGFGAPAKKGPLDDLIAILAKQYSKFE